MTSLSSNSIITVGICPCWDRTIFVDGLQWGQHKKIVSETCVPAGKALNISKALSRLAVKSAAAGLWGRSDYQQMLDHVSLDYPHIQPHFTVVPGQTRVNVTVVDMSNQKDFHLRAQCPLAISESLNKLRDDLKAVTSASTVVFSGSMPAELLTQIMSMMDLFNQRDARLIVDTSGSALKMVVEQGRTYLIKPNLQELSQLLGRDIGNHPDSIIPGARSLCDRVSVVLVSRGADGALLVTQDEAIGCCVKNNHLSVSSRFGTRSDENIGAFILKC